MRPEVAEEIRQAKRDFLLLIVALILAAGALFRLFS
jgi:hypothetical protein